MNAAFHLGAEGKSKDLCYSEANPVAEEHELQEQSSSLDPGSKRSHISEEDIDQPPASVAKPVNEESNQNKTQLPFVDSDVSPQSEQLLMATFSEVVPITTEPTFTLHELSQAYGPEMCTDSHNTIPMDVSSLPTPPKPTDSESTAQHPALHSLSLTQTSSESVIPDNLANSPQPLSSPLDHAIPTQQKDPALDQLPTSPQANMTVLTQPEEDKQPLLEEKGGDKLKMEKQDDDLCSQEKQISIVAIDKPKPHEATDEPATSPPLPTSLIPHSKTTRHMDLAKYTMLSSISIKTQATPKDDRQPLMKESTEKQAHQSVTKDQLQSVKKDDSKGKREKVGRPTTDWSKAHKPSGATSRLSRNPVKLNHESKLSYWREKEEMCQQERAKEWKTHKDAK